MKIKTYRTHSVTKALEEIKNDLGSDAVILNTKRTKSRGLLGLMPKVAYEITAASEAKAAALAGLNGESGATLGKDDDAASAEDAFSAASSRSASGRQRKPVDAYEVALGPPRPERQSAIKPSGAVMKRPSGGDSQDLKPQLERLAQELEKLKKVVSRREERGGKAAVSLSRLWDSQDSKADWKHSEEAAVEMAHLIAQGVDRDLAHSMLRYALRRRSQAAPGDDPRQESSLRPFLREALQRMVQTSPFDCDQTRAAIFIGPTGVGKTTTIAKLAAIFALGEHKRVQLITLDNYRIAAAEQLRTYADIIGVPVRVVTGIAELERAIEEAASQRDCVLIDTTGHSHKQTGEMAALSAFLRRRQDIEKHLVLSITTKADDLREIIEAFGDYAPDKLVFTKLDETSTYGSIAGEVILSGMPLSYVTNGQAVPDDIQVPSPRFISELVVPE
ncbi:MAG TPA: flagellar biosynthesis protein FlhF [Acidobacteriota bacterium]|nr:flagellar biosynthesis protein FlhF [Acidobacteriota bacterium]